MKTGNMTGTDSTPTEILEERARELARDIRRASRAHDQVAEIAASVKARTFLVELKESNNFDSVKNAYYKELNRDIPVSEIPWTCECHK